MVRQCGYANLHGCGHFDSTYAFALEIAFAAAAEDRDNVGLWCGYLVSILS